MANRTSATSGNWRADDADTWGLGIGNYPAAGDLVTILSGHDVTLVEDNVAGAVVINSGGEITGGANKLTLNDAGGTTFIFSSVGTIDGHLDIDITGGSADRPINEAGTGSIRNLVINNAQTYRTHYHLSLTGSLTLTTGTLTTNNGSSDMNLTVTGGIKCIGGTFTGNASTVATGFLEINASGTFNAPNASGSLTINNKDTTTDNRAFDNDATFNHNSGTVTITTASTTGLDLTGTGGTGINNLVINHSSCTGNFEGAISLAGDLTITAGTFKANTPASDTLTVAGDVSVTGTLGNANLAHDQNYSFGSLTIASGGNYYATSGTTTLTAGQGYGGQPSSLENAGTFTNNDGTVLINGSGDQEIKMTGTGNVHNLTVSKSDNDLVHEGSLTVEGDLSITLATVHSMRPNTGASTLTVTGDVTIVEGKLGDTTNYTGAISFGSLSIESGGTYIATSGTTTLTGKNGSNYMLQNSGTFTHNKGTVRFEADTSSGTWYATSASNVEANSIQFYNLETVRTGSAGSYRFFVGGNSFYLVVLNNLTIGVNTNIHSSNGTSILRHYGAFFNIEGSASFDNVTDVQCGLITIGSAGVLEFDSGDQAISCTGIRNLRGSAGIQA